MTLVQIELIKDLLELAKEAVYVCQGEGLYKSDEQLDMIFYIEKELFKE